MTLRGRVRSFFARQLDDTPTVPQRAFDLCAGVLLPLACLALDPGVFRGHGSFLRLPLIRTPCYALIAALVGTLALQLAFGRRLGKRSAPVAGVLRVGTVLSALLAVPIVPLAAFMTMWVTWSLVSHPRMHMGWETVFRFLFASMGFSPLFALFVYERNARRAARVAGPAGRGAKWLAFLAVTLGFGASLLLVNGLDASGMRMLRSEDPALVARGVEHFRRWDWLVHTKAVLVTALRNGSPKAADHAFRELYGRSIGGSDF